MTFGKKLETRNFEFELPEHNYNNRLEITRETVKKVVPDGWTPDMSFSSRESFFTRDKKEYARTTLRRWVEPTNEGNERMIEEITIKFSPGTNIGWVNVRQLPHKITFLYPNRSARTYLLRALPTNSIQR